jgi:rhomboid family GlyGly-CTERM serine protease
MQFLRALLRGPWPWLYLAATALSLIIQLNPAWRDALLYERHAIEHDEWWRIWSGHFVHFGWPHFLADAGLLFILGWLLEARHARFGHIALFAMPLFISAIIYFFDPEMIRYGGLSALNLGLLIYYALQGWQRNWSDWFWPAVLAIYVGEVIYEIMKGGRGGGMIAFDDPAIKVATSAHLASAAYALIAWLMIRRSAKTPATATAVTE